MMAMQIKGSGPPKWITVPKSMSAVLTLLGRVLVADDGIYMVVSERHEAQDATMDLLVEPMREEDNPAIPIHWRTQYGEPIRLAGGRFT